MRTRKQMCVYTSECNTPKDNLCHKNSTARNKAFNQLKQKPNEYLQSYAFVYSNKKQKFDEIPLQQYDQYKQSGYDVIRFI